MLECVDRYWEEAGKGNLSIIMAAALSTVALHAVDRISTRRTQLAPNATVFINKWMKFKPKNPKIRFTDMPDLTCQNGGRLDDQVGFHHVHQILHHIQTAHEYRTIIPTAGASMIPSAVIRRARPGTTADASHLDDFDMNDLALDKMQESMRQLLQTERAIAGLEIPEVDGYICEPLLPFMRRITADSSAPIPIALVFGMEMLLSSFKAFMWPDHTLNKTNCRINVLKFARDVKDEMTTTAQAIDDNTKSADSLRIRSLFFRGIANKLDQVVKEKRFDLYYQAPWTAGSHMSEILDVARYESADVCFRSGYLCAMLHLYNALRALPEPISPILALEGLCQAYKEALFLGNLPSENFSSHYRRATGKGFGRNEATGRVDYRKLSANSQNERNLPSTHLCLFTELHNNCYQTDETFWMRVYSTGIPQRSTRSQRRSVIDEVHSRPFNVALDRIKQAVVDNFQGDLPLARLNLCAVFRFCLKLLQHLGAIARKQSSTNADPTDITESYLGFLYVDSMLESIVEHLRDDKMRPLMRHWRQLNQVKDVFTSIGSDVRCEDFLWNV